MPHSPLLLQLVLILGNARLLSLVLRSLGQPPVIGEMMAGIVLGPVVLGALLPDFHAHVFEPSSQPALDGLSQVGLVLFMFIVGAGLRAPHGARRQFVAAAWVGSMSVLVPMAFGLAAAGALYGQFAPEGVAFTTFALFMASAMSPREPECRSCNPNRLALHDHPPQHLVFHLDQVVRIEEGVSSKDEIANPFGLWVQTGMPA